MCFSYPSSPVVESPLTMELVLNLAWVLLAALMFGLWLRSAPPAGPSRRMQFAALTLLLLILFPVVSVTDDLQAALNPAESDTCLRRDHACSTPHSIFPAVAGLPLPAFSKDATGARRISDSAHLAPSIVDHPAFAAFQNRPPPSA